MGKAKQEGNDGAPLAVVRLAAENVTRLRAVEITPNEAVVEITGRNGAGKSAVLNSIAMAIGGARLAPPRPIRDGESRAYVSVQLGDGVCTKCGQENAPYASRCGGCDEPLPARLIVVREWSADGKSRLTVSDPTGRAYRSPQGVLDPLFELLAFDVGRFLAMPPREQRALLVRLLRIEDTIADQTAARESLLADLRSIASDIATTDRRLAEVSEAAKGAPAERVDVAELVSKLAEASEREHRRERAIAAAEDCGRRITETRGAIVDAEREIEKLEREIDLIREQIAADRAAIERHEANRRASEDRRDSIDRIDPAPIRREIELAESRNAAHAAHQAMIDFENAKLSYRNAEAKTRAKLRDVDGAIAATISGADWPIEGLGLGDDGLVWKSLPLEQASQSERIRVACAVAAALRPRLRVLLVRDGALLDSESVGLLREFAEGAGFQVWLETVGGDGRSCVLIEDGEVATPAGGRAV